MIRFSDVLRVRFPSRVLLIGHFRVVFVQRGHSVNLYVVEMLMWLHHAELQQNAYPTCGKRVPRRYVARYCQGSVTASSRKVLALPRVAQPTKGKYPLSEPMRSAEACVEEWTLRHASKNDLTVIMQSSSNGLREREAKCAAMEAVPLLPYTPPAP